MKKVYIQDIEIGGTGGLALIAGPCVIEDEYTTLKIAEKLVDITQSLDIPLIFKASYEKDNRSDITGYRGPGIVDGLEILNKVKNSFGLPILSDIHRESDIENSADVLDVIQIPAFLCQQTSILIKAGLSNKPINIKKGQFLAPENMKGCISKIASTGNESILLTERGSCFGYNRLISDITCIPIMQNLGYPVIYDATHIVRRYGIPSQAKNGGSPEFIRCLTLSGVSAGANALFLETHVNPAEAKCDASSMLNIKQLPSLLEDATHIHRILHQKQRGEINAIVY